MFLQYQIFRVEFVQFAEVLKQLARCEKDRKLFLRDYLEATGEFNKHAGAFALVRLSFQSSLSSAGKSRTLNAMRQRVPPSDQAAASNGVGRGARPGNLRGRMANLCVSW
jgi:hypothetical protein